VNITRLLCLTRRSTACVYPAVAPPRRSTAQSLFLLVVDTSFFKEPAHSLAKASDACVNKRLRSIAAAAAGEHTVVPANFELVADAAVAVHDFDRRVAQGETVLQTLPRRAAVSSSSLAL
jgi:hypothetical protein